MRWRMRAAWATAWSAPWRRAPLLLRHHPGVLATVAAACAVTAAALAAVPLFLSSVGTESVTLQAAERCPRDTGAVLAADGTPDGVRSGSADPFLPLGEHLGPANRWTRLDRVPLAGPGAPGSIPASLLARDAALDHIEVLEGSAGPGVLITDRAADSTGLRAGSRATIGGVEVPVTGVYRDLSGNTVDDFWCSTADLLLVEVRGGELVRPPPMVIVDSATFARILDGLGIESARSAWEAPLRGDLTVDDAQHLVHQLACGTDDARRLSWCEDGQPLVPRRSGGFRRDPVPARDDADFVERYLHSHLPFVIERSQAIQTSVGGGIWPVAGFAALAGLGLVAAAASLWFDRRRGEVTLLTVRGVSPAGLGAKAVLELLVPSLAGVLGGIALADAMVARLGPSPVLEPAAVGRAALAGLLALLAAAATVGLIVARRVRSHEVTSRRRPWRSVVPWELGLAWVTVVSYQRLGEWGVPVGRGAEVSRVDVWGLLFPVLFLLTVTAVLSRVLALALGPLRAASRTWPTALYLAIRRVARSRVAVLGLVAAAAIAAGVMGYAATMNRSLDATLHAKAATFVGSDLAVQIPEDQRLPRDVAARATEVQVYADAWIDDGRRASVTVVAIDPASFERVAFWDASFSGSSLGDIVQRLATPTDHGAVPAVVVGAELDGPVEVGIYYRTTTHLTIDEAAEVRAFPGMKRSKPTVFVDAAALDALGAGGGRTELWISGDPEDTRAALAASGTAFEEVRRLDEVVARSSFVTVSWTFGFLQSLGLAAGLLVLGGVAVYLDARRRDRLLGYAFMRRMGLSGRQHRRALAVELTAGVVVGCWVGLTTAVAAATLAHGRIDPVPSLHPDPLLRPSVALVAALAVGAVLVVASAAALAQRRIDRDDPVEVLRAGV